MSKALPVFTSRVVPVIVIENADHAVPMAEALWAGGIDVVEITLRSAAALDAIERIAKALPAIKLGAGTLLTAADVARVKNAGATFALSPGCTASLAKAAIDADMPFIPGVMTPSEVMQARDFGFSLMKLFPAAQAGGLEMLKSLASPFADVRFCPTGGVNPANLASFLGLKNVAIAGGSWLTPAQAMQNQDWQHITQLAKQATEIANA